LERSAEVKMFGLIVILVIVFILFNPRLPEVGMGMGQAVRNFKKALSEPDEIDVTPKKKLTQDINKGGEEKDRGE
jgi:sec-independent protein translocase protein TatA